MAKKYGGKSKWIGKKKSRKPAKKPQQSRAQLIWRQNVNVRLQLLEENILSLSAGKLSKYNAMLEEILVKGASAMLSAEADVQDGGYERSEAREEE